MDLLNARRILTLALLLPLAACSGGDAPPAEGEAGAAVQPVMSAQPGSVPTLETATSLGVMNARMPQEGLLTAGQLTQEQFDALADAGYENFISLRLPEENGAGWEEAHAAATGASFTRLAVPGADGLNRETVEELARILDQAGENTVLYCGSSNRVGALLALKAHWVDGMSAEEALEVGRAGGMTRLEPAVVDILSGVER